MLRRKSKTQYAIFYIKISLLEFPDGHYVRIDSGEGKGTMVVCSFRPLGMD